MNIEWLDPWRPIEDPDLARVFEEELRRVSSRSSASQSPSQSHRPAYDDQRIPLRSRRRFRSSCSRAAELDRPRKAAVAGIQVLRERNRLDGQRHVPDHETTMGL